MAGVLLGTVVLYMSMSNALRVRTVHRLEPALDNGGVNGRESSSDSIARVDGLYSCHPCEKPVDFLLGVRLKGAT